MFIRNGVVLQMGKRMNARQYRRRKHWMNEYRKIVFKDLHKFLAERARLLLTPAE